MTHREYVLAPTLNALSPALWAASLFSCPKVLVAVGLQTLRAAFRIPDDPRWDPRELRLIGMTDLGVIAVDAEGQLLAPDEARAPAGGLSLGHVLGGAVAPLAAPDPPDGFIITRAPGGAPIIATTRLDGPLARVEVALPAAPPSVSLELLAALGVRAPQSRGTERARAVRCFEVDLATHLRRAVRELSQTTDLGACNAYFLFGGMSPKAVGAARHALDRACREHLNALAGATTRDDATDDAASESIADAARRALTRVETGAPPLQVGGAVAALTDQLDRISRCPLGHASIERGAARLAEKALSLPRQRLSPAPTRRTTSTPPPPPLPLADALAAACGRLSPRLMTPRARDELIELAAQLPGGAAPDPLALELRFGEPREVARPVDLLACWTWSGGALSRPLHLEGAPEPLTRLRSLWDEREGGPLIERLDQLWLEFDAGGAGRPTPAVFFSARERERRHAAHMLELAAEVASTLSPQEHLDPFLEACRVARSYAGRVYVPNIGLMFPRPRSPLRLIVAPGVGGDDSTIERWLGDDAAGETLRRLWRELGGLFNLGLPALDLGADGPLPSRGIELQIDRGPLRRSALAWREPLRALRHAGLITETEAEAFAGCYLQRRVPGQGWLTVLPAYVKVAVDASGRAHAKGYVSIQRSARPIYELGA